MADAWVKLSATCTEGVKEALGSYLVEWGAGGTAEVGNALEAYYRPAEREQVEVRLARYAADLAQPLAWAWTPVQEEDWWESWKTHFRPAQVSRRLAVCPSWEAGRWAPDDPGVRVIRMDPGRAFGTGTHETSRLCLRLLDECVDQEAAQSLLDVGCGTGILSLGACLLGVSQAVAMDVDPVAAATAKENADINGLADRVLVACADLRAVRGHYPLVVANILYQVLLGLAPALAERVAPGGRLLLSGMLCPEVASAAAVYGRYGLSVEREEAEGEWGALVFRKSA